MTLIDGDRIVTAQLYDDEHEEFIEEKMSIIEYVNVYTNEGVTVADDVLGKIRAEIEEYRNSWRPTGNSIDNAGWYVCTKCIEVIDKYREPQERKGNR